jgi:hypothetical protein
MKVGPLDVTYHADINYRPRVLKYTAMALVDIMQGVLSIILLPVYPWVTVDSYRAQIWFLKGDE